MICESCGCEQSGRETCNICSATISHTQTPQVVQHITINMPETRVEQYKAAFLEGLVDGFRIVGWCLLGLVILLLVCVVS